MNIVLAEDQPLILESLKVLLNSRKDMNVVAAVCDGKAALEAVVQHKPDAAVLDIRMPGMSGLEVARLIKEKRLDVPVLLITTFDEEQAIAEALDIGVEGFLLKDVAPEMFISALRAIATGLTVFHPVMASAFRGEGKDTEKKDRRDYGLTKRDLAIIGFIVRGLTNKEIADLENCAEGTIKNRVSQILTKMDIKARTQIAVKALREGLV